MENLVGLHIRIEFVTPAQAGFQCLFLVPITQKLVPDLRLFSHGRNPD